MLLDDPWLHVSSTTTEELNFLQLQFWRVSTLRGLNETYLEA